MKTLVLLISGSVIRMEIPNDAIVHVERLVKDPVEVEYIRSAEKAVENPYLPKEYKKRIEKETEALDTTCPYCGWVALDQKIYAIHCGRCPKKNA